MTNAITLAVSSTYAIGALHLMMGEAQFFAQQLKLPVPLPIRANALTEQYVSPPAFGFGGTIRASDFSFSFNRDGRLCYVTRLHRFPEHISLQETLIELSHQRSLIDTNGAYQLATNWLSAIAVDVASLERKHSVTVSQWKVAAPSSLRGAAQGVASELPPVPIFDVKWGEDGNPPVWVQILGTTKELLILRMEDTSFSSRPPLRVTNYIPKSSALEILPEKERDLKSSNTPAIRSSNSTLIIVPPRAQPKGEVTRQ